MDKQDVLKQCKIDRMIVRLPDIQLDRDLYMQVAKDLNLIGGKWERKSKGFVFLEDPKELLSQIVSGEKRNLKKEFQFFATPNVVADHLVELADIHDDHAILEPSAGQGAIIKAISKKHPDKKVDCFELMPVNRTILEKMATANVIGSDFLLETCTNKYDRIIANPPFAKNADINHILKMWECINSNGKIITIASKHWKHCNNKKETAFREWLAGKCVHEHEIKEGEFKESGTMVGAEILVIYKS